MCLVCGHIFGRRARSIAPELYPNAVQCTIGSSKKTSKPKVSIYLINPISGIKYLNGSDSETYLVSVEDRSTTICSLEYHTIGQTSYISTYPECDFVVEGSSLAVGL